MKQSFLDSLKDAPIDTAIIMVKAAGYLPHLVTEGVRAITAVARGNTVVLWQENGLIRKATAGDPLELINEEK